MIIEGFSLPQGVVRTRETDTCIDGYSNMYDGLRDDISSLKTDSHTMKKSVMSTESSVSELMSEVTTSRDELREEYSTLSVGQCVTIYYSSE